VSQPCEAPERGVGRDERLCAASHGGGGKDRVEGTEAVLLGEMLESRVQIILIDDEQRSQRWAKSTAKLTASARGRRRDRTCANSWITSGVVVARRRPSRMAATSSRQGARSGWSDPTA
jgi:hypothetical protein